MPSVENGGIYEGDEPQWVRLEKGEVITPLDGYTEEDLIVLEHLQARVDALKGELEERGLSLNDLTSDYFIQQRKDDSNDHRDS